MKPSIQRVRLQLTALFVGAFAIVLLIFGVAIYTIVNREMLSGLDRTLERTVRRRTLLYLARNLPRTIAEDTALYGQPVYVFDGDAKPLSPPNPPEWVKPFVQRVLSEGVAKDTLREGNQRFLLYGQRFRGTTGTTYATVARVNLVEARDRYPSVVRGFMTWGIVALLLVGISGITLAARATRPIEMAFDQMRRFMGDAAHELKTPVAVLRARADVALQRPRSETEYQESMTAVAAEARRLGSLVENMLLLAGADSGEWPIVPQQIYLDDVLLDAASAARALGAQKNVQVDVTELYESPVRADPALLHQLFMILLDNAIYFTPEGGCVTVSAQRNGKTCTATIKDTGSGIPADALPHIFERFYRADPARGRAGAGLGLTIARWIVDEHGAQINVESKEGAGTTVTVEFPVSPPNTPGL